MKKLLIILFILLLKFIHLQSSDHTNEEMSDNMDFSKLTLRELLNIKVTSVSKIEETIADAPAALIVLNKQDLKDRAYTDLVEMFNDLPGIDFVQTWGDLYYKTYWRGYRKGISSPFLLMLDGMVMNHLYYNWTDILVSIPISNIEKIEIVYGPSSSVYGANALMGVVNIITQKDIEENGTKLRSKFQYGAFKTKTADVTAFYKQDDFKLSITGFLNYGDLDKDALENYEYTKSKYLNDEKLWGDFLKTNSIASDQITLRENRSFSANAYFGKMQAGVQYYQVDNKWGINYAFDKTFPSSTWIEEDWNIYFKTENDISNKLKSFSTLRYRISDVLNSSASIEAPNGYGEERELNFGYWQSKNSSWSFYQDFEYSLNSDLIFFSGLKFERKSLSKAYDNIYGPLVSPEDTENYEYPRPPSDHESPINRVFWDDVGIYLQTKYNLSSLFRSDQKHILNLGLRLDDNSAYDSYYTLRAAYITEFTKSLSMKLIYGEAVQEPSPRQLYGAWAGFLTNPNLVPEKSKNIEAVFTWTNSESRLQFNPYYVLIDNSINSINNIPENIGTRRALGLDVHADFVYHIDQSLSFKTNVYYSYIHTKEDLFDNNKIRIAEHEVGDMADHKVYLNFTAKYHDYSLNIRSRFISDRETYYSNPIRNVDSYFTMDLSLRADKFLVDNLSLYLKANNLLDELYYHPGIRDANAGNEAGFWEDNKWYGSRGWANSLLVQPGRSLIIGMEITI